jgi:hypothetical protein
MGDGPGALFPRQEILAPESPVPVPIPTAHLLTHVTHCS